MSENNVNFKISGPALSLLLTDCEKSVSDEMGFLIGEKQNVVTKIVSDAEESCEKMETTVSINAPMPVGMPHVFCNNLGRIDRKRLRTVLGDLEKEVVGWYSFRRNTRHLPLLRESNLHRQLCSIFPHISPTCFTFCIVTATRNITGSTHSYKYSFLRCSRHNYEPVSVAVSNLGEPLNNDYRETSTSNSSEIFQEILQSLGGLKKSKTVGAQEKIQMIEKRLQEKIMSMVERISENEKELNVLLGEERLKRKHGNIRDSTEMKTDETLNSNPNHSSNTVKLSFSAAVKKSEPNSPYTLSQEY